MEQSRAVVILRCTSRGNGVDTRVIVIGAAGAPITAVRMARNGTFVHRPKPDRSARRRRSHAPNRSVVRVGHAEGTSIDPCRTGEQPQGLRRAGTQFL